MAQYGIEKISLKVVHRALNLKHEYAFIFVTSFIYFYKTQVSKHNTCP